MGKKKVLGLDLGVSSVGWSLIELDEEGNSGDIIGIGSRIFEPPVESKTGTPKNAKRRTARGMRRVLARRAMRRDTLIRRLAKAGLLPTDAKERDWLFNTENPYRLRARGLDEKLSLHQLGRALFHMNERRGFLSNRKTGKSKDDGEVLGGISELSKQMAESHSRTLGEFLYRLQRQAQKKRETATLRCRHTARKMYQDEFEALWNKQRESHPELTDEMKKHIRTTIFFQRPLKKQKGLVGLCTFYQWPAKDKKGKSFTTGKKRCARANPLFQRFRILQDLNNLKVNGEPLDPDDRKKLLTKLEKFKKQDWNRVRKVLGLDDRDHINLERESKTLIGLTTLQQMEEAIGKEAWAKMDEKSREGIFEAITTIDDDGENPLRITSLLTGKFKLALETAKNLSKLKLEEGYAPLSLKAIRRILPHLEKGMVYTEALFAAVEELKSQPKVGASDRCFLTSARKMLGQPEPGKQRPKLGSAPLVRNPVVQRALHETRRVVNAIIAKWGQPDEIRVELARDLKLSQRRTSELETLQNEGKKERDEAKYFHEERGRTPKGDDILKYRLWKECGFKCPYTGRAISEGDLLSDSGEVHIEHIIPFSRCFDDGYNNKTLCFADENRNKGNKTPWEMYGHDAQKWGEILQNIQHLPQTKRNRFSLKELRDEVIPLPTRYLNDTRYMSREARDYLRQICPSVQATKGGLTAKLRRFWGLHTLLPREDGEDAKNRADHRHHAIDAAVIALTTPAALHRLSKASARDGRVRADDFPPPWERFRDEMVEKVNSMIVSHRPSRKVSGALHEATSYGKINEPGKYRYRVPVAKLTAPQLDKIRDPRIQAIIKTQVERHGTPEKAAEHCFLENGNGKRIPIKKVRIVEHKTEAALLPIRDGDGKKYRYLDIGNNNHVEIFESPDSKKWKGRFVTTMEAAQRARRTREQIINRTPNADMAGWKFIMSLSANEAVWIGNGGKAILYRVQWISGPDNRIGLRMHHAAGAEKQDGVFIKKPPNVLRQLGCKKTLVTVIGEEKPAHD